MVNSFCALCLLMLHRMQQRASSHAHPSPRLFSLVQRHFCEWCSWQLTAQRIRCKLICTYWCPACIYLLRPNIAVKSRLSPTANKELLNLRTPAPVIASSRSQCLPDQFCEGEHAARRAVLAKDTSTHAGRTREIRYRDIHSCTEALAFAIKGRSNSGLLNANGVFMLSDTFMHARDPIWRLET